MKLFKAHGLGNDYLVLETSEAMDSARVRWICDRNKGVGADGVLEPRPSRVADHGLRIWNPDGSTAEKSGNGIRIFAHWCWMQGAGSAFTVDTGSAVVHCEVLSPGSIRVEMGQASVDPAAVGLDESRPWVDHELDLGEGQVRPATAISIGNPHCVLFSSAADLEDEPWRLWGAALEVDPRFRRRTNVQLARVLSARSLEIRIHERGAGPTLASGSSSCAVVAASVLTGRTQPGRHEVMMPGGRLQVSCTQDLRMTLTGPVAEIGRFEISVRAVVPSAIH